MSPKKTSGTGDKSVGADPSGDLNSDEAGDLPASSKAESYDDSLDAILLQAGARPPETAASKALGAKTLMGIGIESLNLAGLRPAPKPAAEAAENAAGPSGDLTPTVEAKTLASAAAAADSQVSSLLDEVAQALNVQASEYRDRARGKLPGMPATAAAPSPAPAPAARAMMAPHDGAEFEDPDDGPTSLTPGIISVTDEPEDIDLIAASADPDSYDEAVVLGPAGANKSPAGGTDGRSGKLPPIPGLSGPVAAAPVGPPPGAARTATPSSGLPALPTSGRVRLPTPAPGMPSIPPPPSGRLSLPPGMMSAPVIPTLPTLPTLPNLPSPQTSSMTLPAVDLTATAPSTPMALEASRRVSNTLSAPGSGRTQKHGSGRVTQPVIHSNSSSALPAMPTVLAAQVKIATLSLAGLVAVTFAGGLLVGMLVWRSPGRAEGPHMAGTEPATAPAKPAEATPPAAAPEAAKPAVAPAAAAAAVAGAAVIGNGATPTTTTPAATTEAIVTPIAADPGAAPKNQPPRRAVALRQPPRARRPATTTPTVADTATLFPKAAGSAKPAAPAPAAAPKTVASNAPAKAAAPKSKGKAAWHDPFAD